jgi:hypothetical protein
MEFTCRLWIQASKIEANVCFIKRQGSLRAAPILRRQLGQLD